VNKKNAQENAKTIEQLIVRGLVDPHQTDGLGCTALHFAIRCGNTVVVEKLLRLGCRTDMFTKYGESPLSTAIGPQSSFVKPPSGPIVELLLAFGVDLQQELYLYSKEELPLKYEDPQYGYRRSQGKEMDLALVEALKDLRRSNVMFSLQHTCRNVLRRHLKPKADEIIRGITCIPDKMKKFLLVEEEPNFFDWS